MSWVPNLQLWLPLTKRSKLCNRYRQRSFLFRLSLSITWGNRASCARVHMAVAMIWVHLGIWLWVCLAIWNCLEVQECFWWNTCGLLVSQQIVVCISCWQLWCLSCGLPCVVCWGRFRERFPWFLFVFGFYFAVSHKKGYLLPNI